MGFLTAVTLLLFLISLAAALRSRAPKAFLITLVLAVFLVKNLVLSVLFLMDEAPNFNPLLVADLLIVAAMLIQMVRR